MYGSDQSHVQIGAHDLLFIEKSAGDGEKSGPGIGAGKIAEAIGTDVPEAAVERGGWQIAEAYLVGRLGLLLVFGVLIREACWFAAHKLGDFFEFFIGERRLGVLLVQDTKGGENGCGGQSAGAQAAGERKQGLMPFSF